jgi:5'-methylthioadenosine phosphorylase
MAKGLIGIIGGSGLYQMDGVRVTGEKMVETPFGKPSDAILLGQVNGCDVAFLPRHGRGHRILPHEINYRANIFAMKMMGIETIISVSAVGSMKEGIHPGHLVIVDQFVDRTKCRKETFFGDGLAVHASFAEPVCPRLRKLAIAAAKKAGATVHERGTYVCIEGPMFSSRAESMIYRSWDVDVIGMTNYQEAKLAREAEICYATIALSTDYDCWHMGEGPVDVAMVVKTLTENVAKAQNAIKAMLPELDSGEGCSCRSALKDAIITHRQAIADDIKVKLAPIIGKYVS